MADVRQPTTQIQPLRFYLLGFNIQKSFSPLLHNTGFQTLGLPHQYGLFEVENVDDSVAALLQDPDLGGMSVTAPHKLHIGKHMHHISEEARTMGAVNTVVVKRGSGGERVLHGENTDWQGISRCIARGKVSLDETSVGMVVGAGGAARAAVFAMIKLGIRRILLVNRSQERARKLAATFPEHDILVLGSLQESLGLEDARASVVVGCIPSTVLAEEDVPENFFAQVERGVLVEMAYGRETALVAAAKSVPRWTVFDGIDVLQQQAFSQFTMWTGQPARESVMVEAVNKALGRRTNPALSGKCRV